jgi:hypothetical protein
MSILSECDMDVGQDIFDLYAQNLLEEKEQRSRN